MSTPGRRRICPPPAYKSSFSFQPSHNTPLLLGATTADTSTPQNPTQPRPGDVTEADSDFLHRDDITDLKNKFHNRY
ncbi:hypothetical protein Ahia01_001177300 [Argonauta hians]